MGPFTQLPKFYDSSWNFALISRLSYYEWSSDGIPARERAVSPMEMEEYGVAMTSLNLTDGGIR
jgi:hypothetical protein